MSQPLLALDVPWLLYRSFFAIPRSVQGRDGLPVGALLGTVNATLALVEAFAPRVVVCCIGAEEAVYRRKLYAGYHAQREPMPAELRAQWERSPDLLAAFGWHVEIHDELEADDLLWSYARVEGAAGGRTLIATADRDLYQAVDASTAVVELRRDGPPGTIGPDGVRERYGIEPSQVADLIALRGDPSDGIPGAKGVGAKTAAGLLREHGDLDGVLRAATDGRLAPRICVTLRAQAEELRTFRAIATLADVALERPADALTNRAAGASAARELGMNALATRLEAA